MKVYVVTANDDYGSDYEVHSVHSTEEKAKAKAKELMKDPFSQDHIQVEEYTDVILVDGGE